MNQHQALSVLVQAVNVAQSRGAYNLEEANTISQAVTVFKSNNKTETEEDIDDNNKEN